MKGFKSPRSMTRGVAGLYLKREFVAGFWIISYLELKPKEEILFAVQFDRRIEYGQHVEQYRSEVERLASWDFPELVPGDFRG